MITEEITDKTSESQSTAVAEESPSQHSASKNDYSFNWDDANKGDNYTSEERQRMQKLYDESLHLVGEHQIVEGAIVSIGTKDVLVNIGYKSDGLVPITEFRHAPDLKVGDKIEVYIETQEDKNGQLIISHKK